MYENTNVRNTGGYPDIVQVAFRNGHVRSYDERVALPPPYVISTNELYRMFRENPIGYKPKHLKK